MSSLPIEGMNECTLTDEMVNRNKEKLEQAIINIASTIGTSFQRGVKRRITEENAKYLQIDDIKDTFRLCHAELEQKIMNALGGQHNNITIGNNEFRLSRPNVSSEIDNIKAKKGKKTCTVKWTFMNPGDWDVRAMKKKLRNIRKLGDFEVKFIYEGSVIIHTTSDISHFTKDESSIRDITEEFLLLLVRMLRILTTEQRCISYSLQILAENEDDKNNIDTVNTTSADVSIEHLHLPIKLGLIKQIDISKDLWLRDCTSLDQTFVICDIKNQRLILCETNFDNVRYIHLSGHPWRVTAIDNTIVAVGMGEGVIQIVDVTNSKSVRTFKGKKFITGLSYCNGHLYVGGERRQIKVIDLYGKLIRRIPIQRYPNNITLDKNLIFYTEDNKLFCSSLSGKELWECEMSKFSEIGGLTRDEEGRFYITRPVSDKVEVITSDGKQIRRMLSASDGLKRPSGICYNKKLKTLMVCNQRGSALLYKIEK